MDTPNHALRSNDLLASSLHFWWVAFLRSSKDFWWICQQNGQCHDERLIKIWEDFGDLYQYNSFSEWWVKKGTKLFDSPQIEMELVKALTAGLELLADELEAARLLAAEVKSYCSKLDFPDPITVMSGNGYHLYYVLAKLENNDSNKILVEEILQGLAAEFDNSVVSIDTCVYNAGRITKVPGTIMRKGEATEDRPYRMAVICND